MGRRHQKWLSFYASVSHQDKGPWVLWDFYSLIKETSLFISPEQAFGAAQYCWNLTSFPLDPESLIMIFFLCIFISTFPAWGCVSLPSGDTPTKPWSLYQKQQMLSLLTGPTIYLTLKQHTKIRSDITNCNIGNMEFNLNTCLLLNLFLKGSPVTLHHSPTAEMAVINLKWATPPQHPRGCVHYTFLTGLAAAVFFRFTWTAGRRACPP